MKYLVAFLAVIVTACANTHPVKPLGPDIYQLTHTMAKTAPDTGTKNALTDMGRQKCASLDNAPYAEKSIDTTSSGNRKTITLTFTCKPILQNSAYTGSMTDSMPTPAFHTPTENLVSITTLKEFQ